MQSSAAISIDEITICRAVSSVLFIEGFGCSGGVRRTRTDGDDTVIGFDHVAFTGEQQQGIGIANQELGFEPAQIALGSPFLGQFRRGLAQIAIPGFELRFKLLRCTGASATAPAKPTTMLPSCIVRTFRAPCLITISPSVIWPSPAIATVPPRLTPRMVVPCLAGRKIKSIVTVHVYLT